MNPSIVSPVDVAADSSALPASFLSSSASSTTRRGKIARLPKVVRDELNGRLRDGVPGMELVNWLNGLSVVQEVMDEQFEGQEISEQNLSSWRQGGYLEWMAHEERRGWISRISEEAEDLQQDAGRLPLLERIGTQMELLLGRAVESMLSRELDLEDAQVMKRLLALSKEVARHRRLALAAAKVREAKLRQEDEEDPSAGLERQAFLDMLGAYATGIPGEEVPVEPEPVSMPDVMPKEIDEEGMLELLKPYAQAVPGEEVNPVGEHLRVLYRVMKRAGYGEEEGSR
jgi:hypothetical protein